MRCLIIDDNQSFMTAMRFMLQRDGIAVVGTASNASDALTMADRMRPDVILIDIRLGPDSGFEVARRIEAKGQGTDWWPAIVLVSTQDPDELTERMSEHPTLGFLDKTTVSAEKIRGTVCAMRSTV